MVPSFSTTTGGISQKITEQGGMEPKQNLMVSKISCVGCHGTLSSTNESRKRNEDKSFSYSCIYLVFTTRTKRKNKVTSYLFFKSKVRVE